MDNKSLKIIAYILCFALLGVLFGYYLGSSDWGSGLIPDKSEISWVYLLWLALAYFLAVTIHELGHLVAGLVQGFRFEIFVVGFLGVKRRKEGGISLFLNTDMASFGGLAATAPRSYGPETARKFAMVVLVGPLTSMLLAFYSFLAMYEWQQPWRLFHFSMGILSLLIFLAVTLPGKTGLFYTDRKRFQRLMSNGTEKKIELALMKTSLLATQGIPIAEANEADLHLLTQDESPAFRYLGYYYLSQYHQGDESKIVEFQVKMNEIAAQLPKKWTAYFEHETRKRANESVIS